MRTEKAANAPGVFPQTALPAPLVALAERVDRIGTPLGPVNAWSQSLRTTVPSVPPAGERDAAASQGRVLLVEDEPLVRLTTSNMLTELSYSVSESASAEEALALLSGDDGFGAIVTDHLMPGMTGAELARTVRTRWSALPVLIVSGYADLDDVASDLTRLAKPFRSAELAAALSRIVVQT